ncbi:MAG: hypothetical protein QGI83_21685 [Candidatus Latescibacteria bacterium]|nr:hypothetical protein [Candidatus Latescibacterota bacterium]
MKVALDSLRLACTLDEQALADRLQARKDSLSEASGTLGSSLRRAVARRKKAAEAYRNAFQGMMRFRSFGGNPIFSNEDLNVSTSDLRKETADRFYRGKAFSLETEEEIRRYIRSRLTSPEKAHYRAKAGVARIRRSTSSTTAAVDKAERQFQAERVALRNRFNQSILGAFDAGVLARAAVDSTGSYAFARVPEGRYHLLVKEPLPEGWLVAVDLRGHARQDFGASNRTNLLIAESAQESSTGP